MNYPVPYIHKTAADEGIPFGEALKGYNNRLLQYGNEVTTDVRGSKKRRYLQSLGMITSALIGAAGGSVIGGMFGGRAGAKAGGVLGAMLGSAANVVGEMRGYAAPVRSKKEQLAYTNSDDGILDELLVPGVAGYQRGRAWRHIQDAVNREYSNKRVI